MDASWNKNNHKNYKFIALTIDGKDVRYTTQKPTNGPPVKCDNYSTTRINNVSIIRQLNPIDLFSFVIVVSCLSDLFMPCEYNIS